MHHKGTITIETKRLILRQCKMSDAQAMFQNWHSDQEVIKYLRWNAVTHIKETQDILSLWMRQYHQKDYYQWMIEYKEIQEVIGTISVIHHNDKTKMVHIGYCIGKKWWNLGITSEALQALITFFFEEVGVNRIESRHDPNNIYSGKVMMKCGMKQEGILRQADFSNQGIVDACVYAILKEEYEKRKEVQNGSQRYDYQT